MAASGAGLEDVVATTSAICEIRGQEGRLLYRGYDIDELGRQATFPEVAYLLWCGRLPRRAELEGLEAELRRGRRLPAPVLALLRSLPHDALPIDALRTAASLMGVLAREPEAGTPEANLHASIGLTAAMPTVVADFHRLRQGLEPLEPPEHLGHAAAFLYLLTGREPSLTEARALDAALVLQAEHELNASTFAARVTASTLSDLYSAIVSAIGTLKGPLHGGASQEVMELLERIGTPQQAETTVGEMLAHKQKIPGFGHRVYRTGDPRARHFRQLSLALAEQTGNRAWYDLTSALEQSVEKLKPLPPNVDLYSGSVYRLLGIPTDVFTPVFALSRVVGWTAHVLEQYANNRLIRPRASYTGPGPRQYVPIDQRGA